jgi:hypothetical protein
VVEGQASPRLPVEERKVTDPRAPELDSPQAKSAGARKGSGQGKRCQVGRSCLEAHRGQTVESNRPKTRQVADR